MGIGAACNVLGYLVLWAAASGWGPYLRGPVRNSSSVVRSKGFPCACPACRHAPGGWRRGRLGGSLLFLHSPACAPACAATRPQLRCAHVPALSHHPLQSERRQRGAYVCLRFC